MTPEERSDLKSFGPAQRQRIAQQLDSNVHEVDDCIKRFLYLKVQWLQKFLTILYPF